jgi:hypothetical protein
MQQRVTGEKTHEFRKYLINSSVKRIWFYRTAPHSSIKYICEILPAQTRNVGDALPEENGIDNKEYNEHHKDWDEYDYAHKITSGYRLDEPLTLDKLQSMYEMTFAPQGLVYVPSSILEDFRWINATKLP